jgi:hypothetical protein
MERSTWHLLESQGELTCPASKADNDPMFQAAYAWMKTSMIDAGIAPPMPGLTPWWCWVRRGNNHPEPYVEDLCGNDDPVVLQLSIPSHLVVLSCFDLWHFVLNRSYVYTSELDDQEFDRALQMAPNGSAAALRLEDRLRISWAAIFELDHCAVNMRPLEAKSIQGCFWTLRRSYLNAVLESSGLTSYSSEASNGVVG